MIIHKNHAYHYSHHGCHHGSFALPNGLCFRPAENELGEDQLCMAAPDGSFTLQIDFVETEQDARSFLQETFDAYDHCEIQREIFAIEGALTGFGTVYALSNEILEEYVVALKGALMNFWFWRPKDAPYNQELYERARCELLNGVAVS